ncbi:MAG: hypothetical protein PHU91_05780, partial [Candidatus Omnitrophica bacterium]|nr:hypothetical protein [Candidatus Omnitrophota bacterium]
MSLKKCLRSKRGWSFIEYALIFVAVVAGVVVLLQQTLSGTGTIHKAFQQKATSYIAAITNNTPINDGNGGDTGSGCDRAALQTQIDMLNQQIAALERQIVTINEEIETLEGTKHLFRPACERCHNYCETSCTDSCNLSCEANCTYSLDVRCFPDCLPPCISDCRVPCDENCDSNNSGCVQLKKIENLQADLRGQIGKINQQIQDSRK